MRNPREFRRFVARAAWWSIALLACAVLFPAVVAAGTDTMKKTEDGAEQTHFDDADVTRAIEVELIADPAVVPNGIDVSTKDGIVMLEGNVSNLLSKRRAEHIASSTRGVRAVINRIEVTEHDRSDRAIQVDVEYALADDPATESWEIRPRVRDGVVTLTGSVDSWAEKRLAEEVATGVLGVREVHNELGIDEAHERPDGEIEAEIERRLEMDVWVGAALVDVEVQDARVSLSGEVGSNIEKTRAITDSWVAGVTDVNAEKLEVVDWVRDRNRRTAKQGPTDEQVEQAVRDALEHDPRLSDFDVNVSATSGTVTLAGVVNNLAAKTAAEDDARNVIGVMRVHNFVKVRMPNAPTDALIEQRVERALVRDPFVYPYDIDVQVDAGVVTLKGDVQVPFERERAERVASRVSGTVYVKNMLSTPIVYDPLTYRTLPPPYADRSPLQTDEELEQNIRDQLFWSPFVDADEVNVSVVNGVATLTGTVDSASERKAARDNAYDGGAVAVTNDLNVRGSNEHHRRE